MFNLYMMKKTFIFLIILLIALCTVRASANAQMMGKTVDTTGTEQTSKDEASGKAVWDKLQNRQISCEELKDDDFDVLGDFFMGNMMGGSHDAMNSIMVQQLGSDGEKQMHIAMGKRLSGCQTNAVTPQGPFPLRPTTGFVGGMMNNGNRPPEVRGINGMMGLGYRNMTGLPFGIFGLLTWIALLAFLILGSIYFWREIQRKK